MKTRKVDHYLFEESSQDNVEFDEPSDAGDHFIDIVIGKGEDKFQEKIPKSTLGLVVTFIRELLKDQMDPKDVIKLIMTDPRVSSRKPEDVTLIGEILEALSEKYDSSFINKIPVTFPFLAALNKTTYDITNLDEPSRALLNTKADQIGRGEIAIPLLFGIKTFKDPKEVVKKGGTSSYDLVLNGKRCDVKDFRNESKKGGLVDTDLLRVGGPAGKLIRAKGNASLKSASNKYLKELRVEDFSGMRAGAEALIGCVNSYLRDLSVDEHNVQTRSSIKNLIGTWANEVLSYLDKAVHESITEKYDGGFFTISSSTIDLVPGTGFDFYACKSSDQRIIVERSGVDIFRNGLIDQLNNMFDEKIVKYLENEVGRSITTVDKNDSEPIKAPRPPKEPETPETEVPEVPEQEPATEPESDAALTESVIRRLLSLSNQQRRG
jgi:hypothetical protein